MLSKNKSALLAGASAAVFDKPPKKNDDESYQEGYTPKNMHGVLHHHKGLKASEFPSFQHIADVQMQDNDPFAAADEYSEMGTARQKQSRFSLNRKASATNLVGGGFGNTHGLRRPGSRGPLGGAPGLTHQGRHVQSHAVMPTFNG